MPQARNPYFTGREEVLDRLYESLAANKATALTQAISGLGGIGKTQTAVEYAYRHQDDYQAVFWVRADSESDLREGFVEIARRLGLPEANEADQSFAVAAAHDWLENNADWLLIFDNADDLDIVASFLPTRRHGHILLTTRAQAMGGIARPVRIDRLSEAEGALLLLRRANLLEENAPFANAKAKDQQGALVLTRELDGLPLALDQAGAYIEQMSSSPAEYLQLYRERGKSLRAKRGGIGEPDHASVTVTFSLALEKVAELSPAGADLLCCCAFLAPDAIPEAIIREGAGQLGDTLGSVAPDLALWLETLEAVCRYSLMIRDPDTRMLSMHRLVQEVIKDAMDAATQRLWAERVIGAVAGAYPGSAFSNWPACEQFLPQWRTCAMLIQQWDFETVAAAALLAQAGYYLKARAQYAEALPLVERALAIYEKVLGDEHPHTATSLNNLAELYRAQGNTAAALPLYERALAIYEKALGDEHPNTAQSFENYAYLLRAMGREDEAGAMQTRAEAIRVAHAAKNSGL